MTEHLPEKSDYQIFDISDLSKKKSVDIYHVTKADESVKSRPGCRCTCKKVTLAVVMAIAIVAASVFAAFFVINMTSSEILFHNRRSMISDDYTIREDVSVDSKHNLAKYEISQENVTNSVVLLDSNRDLQIYKTKLKDGMACLITPIFSDILEEIEDVTPPFSSNLYQSPSATMQPIAIVQPKVGATMTSLKRSARAIKDTGLLGEKGASFCKGLPVYWTQKIESSNAVNSTQNKTQKNADSPSASPASSQSPISSPPPQNQQVPSKNPSKPQLETSPLSAPKMQERRKRATGYYACYFDFDNCYYFSFPDDYYNAVYFTCNIVCRWY